MNGHGLEATMADDPKNEPVFRLSEGAVTHLHGAEVPRGIITIDLGAAEAKIPTPEQSELVVNGSYSFARRLSEV
jgi:hypothetical protein